MINRFKNLKHKLKNLLKITLKTGINKSLKHTTIKTRNITDQEGRVCTMLLSTDTMMLIMLISILILQVANAHNRSTHAKTY